MPAEASSSCPSDAKREATNANARYGVDDPFDRERPPPIERPHKRDVVERRFKGRARARATITRRDALSRERQKSLRRRFKRRRDFCAIDDDDDDDFDEIPIHLRTDDESVRRFLPLENGRRDVFGLVSLLLLLERGGGFFRRFVAIIAAASVAARRCHVSLSLSSMKMDSMDEKKVKKKMKKKKNS